MIRSFFRDVRHVTSPWLYVGIAWIFIGRYMATYQDGAVIPPERLTHVVLTECLGYTLVPIAVVMTIVCLSRATMRYMVLKRFLTP